MKVYIAVKMREEYIFDLLLYHVYSKLSGFLMNILGLTIIMGGGFMLKAGSVNLSQALVYVLLGIGVLLYTPINLKIKARNAMKEKKYQDIIHYDFDDNGIKEKICDNKITCYKWNQVEKALATPKDIAFYLPNDHVLIVPKEQFKDDFVPVMQLVAKNMPYEKIYIR